jgi:hypothetical protein
MKRNYLVILMVFLVIAALLGGRRLLKKAANQDLQQRQIESMQKLRNINNPSSKGVGELIPSK